METVFDPSQDDVRGKNLSDALDRLFSSADNHIQEGSNILILSDRNISNEKAAIPALLAVPDFITTDSKVRTKVSLVIESGEPREVQHFALLLGYGADLINPYLSWKPSVT